MATGPIEILNERNAEVQRIRNFADLTEEAKARRIAEVSERARAEYQQALEEQQRERAERLERSKRAVFRVPATATDAEEAQIHAAYRAAYNEVYYSTSPFADSPGEAQEELERQLEQAERSGDKLMATTVFHRAIDLGIQSVVDSHLSTRPAENKAWESYTEAQAEVNQSRDIGFLFDRAMAERAFSEQPSEFAG